MGADDQSGLDAAIAALEARAQGRLPLDHYVRHVAPVRTGEKSWIAGYPDYQPAMDRLWAALTAAGMGTVTPAAYDDWLAKGLPPIDDPAAVAALGREELLLRLFAIRRAERFCDGYWTGALERGLLLGFARRLRDLNEGRPGP